MRQQSPALAVLGLVAAGLLIAALVHWKPGTLLVGLALLLAAGLRLSLPARRAGWLAVRARPVDAAVLLVLGFGTVALSLTVPEAR